MEIDQSQNDGWNLLCEVTWIHIADGNGFGMFFFPVWFLYITILVLGVIRNHWEIQHLERMESIVNA